MISGGLRKVSGGEKPHTHDILSPKSSFFRKSKFLGRKLSKPAGGGLGEGSRPPPGRVVGLAV